MKMTAPPRTMAWRERQRSGAEIARGVGHAIKKGAALRRQTASHFLGAEKWEVWSGKDKLDFLLRTLKRIAARIPLETCSPGWNACAPYCNRALCT